MQRARQAAALLASISLWCACDTGASEYYGTTEPLHGPNEIWSNLGSEPEWIDPGKCSDSNGGKVIFNIFAGLVQPHPVTLQPMPDIARGWKISEDGLRYTFYLRRSTWSDGVALTAHDFEYAFKRVLDRDTASKYASFLFPIKNAEAYNRQAVPASAVGARAVSDYVFEVTLENPLPYFLDLMMFYTAQPVPRHVIERLQEQGKNPDLWTRPEHIVSNGAFLLKEWRFRQYMMLEKNPRYWAADQTRLQRVRLSMVESYNTTLNLYEAGELDYIGNSSLPSEFIEHLKQYEDFQSGPYLGTYFYWINVEREPLDDVRVRRALSLAIDRRALVEYVTRGGQIPTADIVPDGVGGYDGLDSPTFEPERARELLVEAGYPKGEGMPPITLTYNTSEGHKQIAEAVQHMWKKHLGIPVELENQEWKVYLKNLQATEFQIARMGWIGDYNDPFTFLELLTEQNGNNHSNWTDAGYERLLAQANTTLKRPERLALLRQAEQRLSQAAPVIPIYVYTRLELVKPYVMGYFLNYQHRVLYKYVWIDRRWYDGVPEPLPNPPPPMIEPEPVP